MFESQVWKINQISVSCKHERFEGNVSPQSVDCVQDRLRVASASLALMNLAG